MAFSTQRVVSDGSLVLLTIDIDYFERDEIAVFFDGILDALPWAWVGSTERKISFTPAVPNGVEVLIRRSTKLDTVLHEFQLGAAFTEDSVDENFAQILHIAQEAVEGGSLGDIFNDLDMHGYKIKNTGTATDPTDVVTFQQFSTHDAAIIGYRDQAAASAAAAAVSAANAAAAVTAREPFLLDRANHTGTQAISTVTGLQAALDAKQATLVSGTNIKTINGSSVLGSGDLAVNAVYASAAENAAGTVENKAVDPLGVREAFNATGSAPVFACRAWVNFDGTRNVTDTGPSTNGAPVLLRGSGNVTSVVKNNTGDFTVNLTVPMPDANYAVSFLCGGGNNYLNRTKDEGTPRTVSAFRVLTLSAALAANDPVHGDIMVYR